MLTVGLGIAQIITSDEPPLDSEHPCAYPEHSFHEDSKALSPLPVCLVLL